MPGGAGLVAIKTTKDPKAVARVMEYLASEEVLREFYGRTLFVPFGAVYQFYRDPTLPVVAAPAPVLPNPAKAAVPRRRAGPRRMLASAGAVAARPAAAAAAPGSTAEGNLAGAMAGVLSDMRSGAQGKGESATGFIPLPSH